MVFRLSSSVCCSACKSGQDEVEEDGEGQVEVVREEGEVREKRTCMAGADESEDSRTP